MTDGISTSPHCLYKSNIVDDVIINKTRQNELVKVFCEYKTEFLILFDDFFRSQDFPKPSPVLHHFFQYTHLRDAHFYRCKLIEHTVQFYFLNTKCTKYSLRTQMEIPKYFVLVFFSVFSVVLIIIVCAGKAPFRGFGGRGGELKMLTAKRQRNTQRSRRNYSYLFSLRLLSVLSG